MERWIALLGLAVIMALAWAIGDRNWRLNYRIIAGGLLLQFALALFILKTPVGVTLFQAIGDVFAAILGFTDAGSIFVFGEESAHHFIAFRVLPTIIFVSSVMSVLYYLGILQRIIFAMAWLMRRTLGTSGSETLAAAANVFVGQTEAPLMVRPYVMGMTRSELMALMVGGFSTIAGSVFAVYVGMGIDAGHLVSASVISAPAALLIAKLMVPETGVPRYSGQRRHRGGEDSRQRGGCRGRGSLGRSALGPERRRYAHRRPGPRRHGGRHPGPVRWMDRGMAGTVLGLVTVGYLRLRLRALRLADGHPLERVPARRRVVGDQDGPQRVHRLRHPGRMVRNPVQRSCSASGRRTILTYALCGFANFGSIGIQIGGIGGIAPERRLELARLSMPAMLGGTFAMMMTACIAATAHLRSSP